MNRAEYDTRLNGLAMQAAIKLRTPARAYHPNTHGQTQFHAAKHRFRCMFPGNRFGKTTAMGVEADRVLQARRSQVWWFAPQLRQFDELKAQLDTDCLTQGYAFNASDLTLTWPNGSRMTVWPADRDPHYVQGPNPDLICFDEEPPEALWVECNARGYGARTTRYVVAATATGGVTWMFEKLYQPWLRFHEDRGLDEDRAMVAQLHPDLWVWPKGGIHDNPSIPREKADEFARQDWGGPKQAKVRISGGFADWIGDAVFDADALADARKTCERLDREDGPGKSGGLDFADTAAVGPDDPRTDSVPYPDPRGGRDSDGLALPPNAGNRPSGGYGVLSGKPESLVRAARFAYSPLSTEGGRVEFWRLPEHGRVYVIGADFAYGLEGRDWDTACVLRVGGGDQKPEQVAEAQGHWGPDFERILYGLLRFYNDAYLLGEAQVGLTILRRLREEYGYTRMFSERTEGGRVRKATERLGYHTSASDVTLPKLRRSVLDKSIVWRSRPLLDQMGLLQFRPTNERLADKATDVQLRVKLARGGSPDLVRAAGFAGHALGEVFWAPPQVQIAPPGSLGDTLGYNETMGISDKPRGIRWTR